MPVEAARAAEEGDPERKQVEVKRGNANGGKNATMSSTLCKLRHGKNTRHAHNSVGKPRPWRWSRDLAHVSGKMRRPSRLMAASVSLAVARYSSMQNASPNNCHPDVDRRNTRGRRNIWGRCNTWDRRNQLGPPQPMALLRMMGSPQLMGSPPPVGPPRPRRSPQPFGSPRGHPFEAVSEISDTELDRHNH